ncbi:dihydrofolate reductase [Thiotrichales bacterium 19S3-7]|nr:dihydrofolate reductase [Thiotrichales bacterium 19S3-7]MCF6800903.1 dihydrofolate reductase [Thiotrichales bacterium 19S3-11]
MISFIVAYAKNRVMGKNNQLPWQISDDLKLFKQHTINKPIVMGRKTYESIGRPLPQRRNIILTRNQHYHASGTEVYHTIEQINDVLKNEPEVFIIGGAELFKLYMPFVEKLYLSKIQAELKGDTFFPAWDDALWQKTYHKPYPKNDLNEYAFDFEIWQRRKLD